MSQYDFGTIDASTKDGSTLASDLNSWRDALHSGHKSSSRPSYVVAGMQWVNDSTNPWVLNLYDGTDDIPIGTINTSTNVFTPSGTLPVAAGGTGATTASAARTSLGAQETLVSATNIKTVNGTSLLGSGDISLQPSDGDKGDITVSSSGSVWTIDQKPTLGTSVTASGTSVDFTGIPSWVKRITVIMSEVSTSGTSHIIARIGPAITPETSGYLGSAVQVSAGAGTLGSNATDGGFCFATSVLNTTVFNGACTINLLTGSTWVHSGNLGRSDTSACITSAGSKTITGTLGIVRITTVNGTDTFDAGTINIMYEG